MARPRTLLHALGAALYLGHNVAAAPLDIGLDICIPFGIEVGLFIDLFEPPQVTEVVPVFTIRRPQRLLQPAHIPCPQSATELCVSSVTTKTTTYPCSATSSSTSTPTPTLSCDPYGYLIQSTTLYRVDLTTGKTSEVATGIGNNKAINAIGYNILDNYLYGYQIETNKIVKISADGTTVTVDTDTPVQGGYVGDVDSRGHYWLAVGPAKSWGKFDLAPGSPTFGKQLANGTAAPPGNYDVADWVYVPSAGEYLYAVGSISSTKETALLRFSMASHRWETVAEYGKLGVVGVGAMYGMNNGTLYASENGNGQIWQFPLSGDKPFLVSQGPSSGSNDGARCVLNLLGH